MFVYISYMSSYGRVRLYTPPVELCGHCLLWNIMGSFFCFLLYFTWAGVVSKGDEDIMLLCCFGFRSWFFWVVNVVLFILIHSRRIYICYLKPRIPLFIVEDTFLSMIFSRNVKPLSVRYVYSF